ncbi:2-C-methyl-D-erythritol 4-phosphate cytidylyltransferase [Aeromicrobium sp. YIM 150415]|uniref:2-C-methyl-D-erythritol 4-phosphate cytidylyltransferase n=1 Tax=Aeromicrobium sp. YIM 150415 TaxID=2803912 RepID=UPI001963EC56|nr:2-C-methyl-D-erythritol 4-phosphate cytidylyltransferase [Aeromicrobium sp. YIM 150415]MBM9461933.1 2-C-methyl-D-erythritol 4-phosphate cytidylyltransferase [Aeromicrobium sp. YIM 150415]
MSDLRTVAVILAGGTGTRFGRPIPKQLIELAGRPIIEHSIAAFHAAPQIDEIVVLMAPGHLDDVRELVEASGYDKVTRILEGGSSRSETTSIALGELGDEDCRVLFHDAARPLVTQEIIAAVTEALERFDAVTAAIPSSDTVFEVEESDETTLISGVLARPRLRRCQTPQGFRRSVLSRAYERAWKDTGFVATDDCSVVVTYTPEVPVAVVPGDERNLKVTGPDDLHIAEGLIEMSARSDRS